jgi:hypothetical protein
MHRNGVSVSPHRIRRACILPLIIGSALSAGCQLGQPKPDEPHGIVAWTEPPLYRYELGPGGPAVKHPTAGGYRFRPGPQFLSFFISPQPRRPAIWSACRQGFYLDVEDGMKYSLTAEVLEPQTTNAETSQKIRWVVVREPIPGYRTNNLAGEAPSADDARVEPVLTGGDR